MSEPLSSICHYCGSPSVLDDAWWCDSRQCWDDYYHEQILALQYEARTPLTKKKAEIDLIKAEASIWGHGYIAIYEFTNRLVDLAKYR